MKQSVISLAVASAFAAFSLIPVAAHATSNVGVDKAVSPYTVVADRDGGDGGDGDGDRCPRRHPHCDDGGDDGDDGGDS